MVMPTQLEDISNQVAQEKISNSRLRNEEIRRNMANPWSQKQEQKPVYTPQDVYANKEKNPTLATTYSSLLNNANYLQQEYGNSGGDGSSSGPRDSSVNGNLSGALAGLGTFGAAQLGAGKASGAVGAAINGLQGNYGSMVGNIGTTIGALANLGPVSGMIGQLAKDTFNDVSPADMLGNLGIAGVKGALFGAVPGLGAIYGLAQLFGLDVENGIGNITGKNQAAPGFNGTLGGFFGKNALGLGVDSGLRSNDTPLGFDPSDLGTGIENLGGLFGPNTYDPTMGDYGTGITGSISGNFGNWGADLGAPDTGDPDGDTEGTEGGGIGGTEGSGNNGGDNGADGDSDGGGSEGGW